VIKTRQQRGDSDVASNASPLKSALAANKDQTVRFNHCSNFSKSTELRKERSLSDGIDKITNELEQNLKDEQTLAASKSPQTSLYFGNES